MISPIARSSSHATSFSMRLTFRLRPPSPTRILLIFCYRTYSPRLLRPPRTLGTRRPWKMPATPSGWTPPSFGMALPTGCPRASARLLQLALRRPCRPPLHPRPRHPLRLQVPALLHQLPPSCRHSLEAASGLFASTLVVRHRSCKPRLLQRRRRQRCRGHQILHHGRLDPGRAPCRRPSGATATLRRRHPWLLCCPPTLVPPWPTQIGGR